MTLTFSAVTADMDSSRFPSALLRTARQLNLSDDFLSFSGGDFAGNLVFIEQPKHAGSPAPAHKRGNTAGGSMESALLIRNR